MTNKKILYQQDTEIELQETKPRKYYISSQHRKKGNPNKSIWIISFEEEVNCFIQTISNTWKVKAEAWGIKLNGNTLQVVGLNNNNEELKLAKFVDGTNTDVWHGYPADYVCNAQDRPTTEILKYWVHQGYITKSKMKKIRQGQPCNL
jgi:hypothetical protein